MEREQWSPPFALHVVGEYDRRTFDEDGLPEPQKVVMDCKRCGAHWETMCSTGQVRAHISRFGMVHLHSDPLKVKR